MSGRRRGWPRERRSAGQGALHRRLRPERQHHPGPDPRAAGRLLLGRRAVQPVGPWPARPSQVWLRGAGRPVSDLERDPGQRLRTPPGRGRGQPGDQAARRLRARPPHPAGAGHPPARTARRGRAAGRAGPAVPGGAAADRLPGPGRLLQGPALRRAAGPDPLDRPVRGPPGPRSPGHGPLLAAQEAAARLRRRPADAAAAAAAELGAVDPVADDERGPDGSPPRPLPAPALRGLRGPARGVGAADRRPGRGGAGGAAVRLRRRGAPGGHPLGVRQPQPVRDGCGAAAARPRVGGPLGRSQRALVTAVTWPLLLRYRYPLRPGRAVLARSQDHA